MTPHALDVIVATVIFLSTLVAYFRGIIREFFTLAGLGLATLVSYESGHLLTPGVGKWLGAQPEGGHEKADVLGLVTPTIGSYIVSYGGVFLLVFILMIIIRIQISGWIKAAGLTVVDRLLGAGFGFLRGFLLVFAVYATCYYLITKDKFPDWAKNSNSVPILDSAMAWTDNHFNLKEIIEDRGKGIAIKLDKVDLDKIGKETGDAAKELKAEVKKEEADVQKAVSETPTAPVPAAAPAPVPPISQPPAAAPAAPPPPVSPPPVSQPPVTAPAPQPPLSPSDSAPPPAPPSQ